VLNVKQKGFQATVAFFHSKILSSFGEMLKIEKDPLLLPDGETLASEDSQVNVSVKQKELGNFHIHESLENVANTFMSRLVISQKN